MESKAPVQKKKRSRVWLWVLIAVVVTTVRFRRSNAPTALGTPFVPAK